MIPDAPQAPTLDLLSAGAIKALIAALVTTFADRTGAQLRVRSDTAPAIAKRLEAGEPHDLVAAPRPLIDTLAAAGRIAARTSLSRVGIGMVGRAGCTAPDISSEAAFRLALTRAEAIVINTASTGLHMETLIARLGLTDELADRMVRMANGRGVMVHMAEAPASHIGFGAVTEIEVHRHLGVHVAAELPATLQNYTTYDVVSLAGGPAEPAASAFVGFVGSPQADACFAACRAERAG